MSSSPSNFVEEKSLFGEEEVGGLFDELEGEEGGGIFGGKATTSSSSTSSSSLSTVNTINYEQGLSREEGESKDAVEDGKKKKETATTTTTTPTIFFAAPPPPPREEEECPFCLEVLPVDASGFLRLTCCGKGLHKDCHAGIVKSTMSHKQKSTCIMCRAKHPTTDKEGNKRLCAWVKKGKAWAQSNLASAYRRGDYGLPQSYLMAVKLYGMAVKQGNPDAMFDLGTMYREGNGVDQSYEKAVELYKMAADRGHATAQYKLGCAYGMGQCVDQSIELTREWLTKAAAQKYENAIKALKKLDAMEGKITHTSTPPTPLVCSTCGTPETTDRILRACKQCHTTQYCNTACQRQHWGEGGHKRECKKECKKQKKAKAAEQSK